MGKKQMENSKVKGAPKTKVLAVTNITKETEDKDVEEMVMKVGSVTSFRKAYNLEKMHTKQFTFQVPVSDIEQFLDEDKWPSGVCCRFWDPKPRKDVTKENV